MAMVSKTSDFVLAVEAPGGKLYWSGAVLTAAREFAKKFGSEAAAADGIRDVHWEYSSLINVKVEALN